MTTLRPLSDYIWVSPLADNADEPYQEEVVSQPGLLVIVEKQKAATRGRVKAIGPGKRNGKGELIKMPPIQVGDLIRWTPGSAQRVLINGEKLYLISAEALLGIEVR